MKVVALAAVVLFLVGCGNKPADKAGEAGVEKKSNVSVETKKDKGGAISSIKDAMGLGKAMKCAYKFEGEDGGSLESVVYIDGKKYKAESTVMGKKQNVIFDETAMYSWAEGEKTGMKMTIACMEEMNKNLPEGDDASVPETKTDEDFFDDATDVSCEPYSGADFSIPKSITFTDQCEMLKGIMKDLPAGIDMPVGIEIPELP